MDRDKQLILTGVRRRIEAERSQITAANGPRPVEVTIGPAEYQIAFIKPCKAAMVTANYVLQIKAPEKPPVHAGRKRTFGCAKFLKAWICN